MSSFQAACSTSSRACSIAIRASAIRSGLPPSLASGRPNATRSVPRRQASSSAFSARPMSRMQWCTRPGPRRPWAIANASPGPSRMLETGTRTSVNEISAWPSGSSYMLIAVSLRSTVTPGVSRGTSTIECRWCRSASGSVSPMKTKILQSGLPAPVDHHLRPLMTTSSPSTTAVAAMLVASEEATSGSVMRERGADPAVEQRLEPGAPLLLVAVLQQHLHVAGVRRVAVEHQRRQRRASPSLGERRVVDVGQPLAAVGAEPLGVVAVVLARQEEVPQPLRAGLGLQLGDHRQRVPGVAAGLAQPGESRRGSRARSARSRRRTNAPTREERSAARGDGLKSMRLTVGRLLSNAQ